MALSRTYFFHPGGQPMLGIESGIIDLLVATWEALSMLPCRWVQNEAKNHSSRNTTSILGILLYMTISDNTDLPPVCLWSSVWKTAFYCVGLPSMSQLLILLVFQYLLCPSIHHSPAIYISVSSPFSWEWGSDAQYWYVVFDHRLIVPGSPFVSKKRQLLDTQY